MTEIGPTLPDHAERMPNKPALIMGATGESITFAALEERSNRCAQLFRSLGLRPGDHIAIYLENSPRYHEIFWAAHRAGLYYTCISSYLTAPEVAFIVEDCGARVVLSSTYKRDVAGQLPEMVPGVEHWLMHQSAGPHATADDAVPTGFARYEDAVASQPASRIADEMEGLDMLYSSGTTGRPKAIKRFLQGKPFGTVDPALIALGNMFGIDGDTIYLSPAPLYHAAPLRYNLRVQVAGGTTPLRTRT